MNTDYEDIRSRIALPVRWFDEHAVPRYCDYSPEQNANIYAQQACLLLIECQGCGHEFRVCVSASPVWDSITGIFRPLLEEQVRAGSIGYGDPPNVRCCPSGPTMSSVPRQVLEFWRRDKTTGFDWKREPELQIDVSDPVEDRTIFPGHFREG